MSDTFEDKRRQTAERLGITPERIPEHVAIIMDGNGRWAEKKGLPRAKGHRQGGRMVEKIANYCVEVGIKALTLYSFSAENWKRPHEEIKVLMHLYTRYLIGIRPMLEKNKVRLAHLGRLRDLPDELIKELNKTMELTAANTGMVLALALNYGARDEIADAVRAIAQKCKDGTMNVDDIDDDCISRHLYTAGLPDPDLLIRTAGEMRISNFLLWQISYAEFYATETLWPDFGKSDLDEAILAYSKRVRRFGKTNSQLQVDKSEIRISKH